MVTEQILERLDVNLVKLNDYDQKMTDTCSANYIYIEIIYVLQFL